MSDLGKDGISNFFFQHKCNELCSNWKKPLKIEKKYKKQMSTSFEKPIFGINANKRGTPMYDVDLLDRIEEDEY